MVDVLVLLVLFTSAVLGFWTGLLVQFARLASVLLSVAGALIYGPQLAVVVQRGQHLRGDGVWMFLAPLAVFVAGLTVCYLVTFVFSGLLRTTDLSLADRLAGAGIGLVKGVFIVGIVAFLTMANATAGSPLRARVQGSVTAWGAALTTWMMVMMLPEDFQADAPGGGDWVWPGGDGEAEHDGELACDMAQQPETLTGLDAGSPAERVTV